MTSLAELKPATKLRVVCRPGFILLLLLGLLSNPAKALGASSEAIGYATVAQAYDALQADSAAGMQQYEGWTLFNQKGDGKYVLWSFTPEIHPAHPSVIRRVFVKRGDQLYIQMDALCEAPRPQCDALIVDFRQINERIKQSQGGGS